MKLRLPPTGPSPRVLSWLCLLLALCATARGQAVINEIYYDPADNTAPTEFVELYNPTNAAIDLSGWKFDSGIDYTFPSGASLPAKGYAVVAQDAAAFRTAFGFTPYGPFSGKLSNDGERLRLRNAASATVNDLTYGAGFPWPTAARGQGASMELINPALDNAVPGAWRSSGQAVGVSPAQVFVPPVSVTWHYRKGTSEASSPVGAWRQIGFVEDSSWEQAQTSIGYGDDDDNTELTDMENRYSSLYLRRIFSVAPGQIPSALTLRVRVDDGCVVWINGTEVARFHVPAGALAYNSFAANHDADVSAFEEIAIPNAASLLVEGDNVIAIHALNSTLNSSDFTIDAQLLSAAAAGAAASPTPGRANAVLSAQPPPAIDQVANLPVQPTGGQPVTVTAHVVGQAAGVAAVTLAYQVVDPGAYIRKSDPAYATSWTNVPMADNGAGGDAVAGDGVYTAVLPAALQVHRRLIRYRVTAADSAGNSIQVPYADDDAPNFAYFVYNAYPSWSGAFVPGSTAAQTFTASLLQSLPVYQLIANSADVANSQYTKASDGARMWGTVIYNNKVYDHVQFNNRGEASTYVSGKNKWRIHFNTARDFQPADNWGRPYPETWDELTMNACASPWVAGNRGMAGMDEAVSFRFQELAGVPSPKTHFFHFRVIDDAAETDASSQFSGGDPAGVSGDLWGLYLAVETPDGGFLDSRTLPDGNVYKIESSLGDKKHQGGGQSTDTSDWDSFRTASGSTQTEAWWRANLDMPTYYSFQASNRALGNVDLRPGFNHFFYHNPDGHWTVIPWDLDMMFIAKTHQAGTILQNNSLSVANLSVEYKNRCRELLDLILADAGVSGGQVGQLIDEYAQMVNPNGVALTWADLDAAMWNMNPRTTTAHKGNFFKTPITDSRKGGTWVRTLATADHEGFVKFLIEYTTNAFPTGQTWAVNNGNQLGYGYKFVESDSADATVPNRPTAAYTGPANYPLNDLRFASGAYSSPRGASSFAAVQWRIGEISAPGIPLYDATQPRLYEITDIWRSAEVATVAGETRIPGSNLKVGHTYRVRVRHKDNTGRWSRWSLATQFVAGSVAVGPYQQSLAVTEIMYNPGAATSAEIAAGFTTQDFEYLKLKNVGASALDMSVVSFTSGITFSFPAGSTLTPGASVLVVKNTAAFALRYGSGKPVIGAYTKNLSNSGDTIALSLGGSATIRSFAYSDGSHPAVGQSVDPWPVEADGTGYSLVLINPDLMPDHALASNWRASRLPGGSPGAEDTVNYSAWSANYPGAGAVLANPDGDEFNNLLEYAMGLNPMQRAAGNAVTAAMQNFTVNGVSAPYLTYTFRRQIGATDLTYRVEFSANLSAWAESGVRVSSTLNGDGTATEVWRAGQSTAAAPGQFVHLRVTQP